MALDWMKEKGTPIEKQLDVGWKDLVSIPASKLEDDAFTKVRAILINGIELESLRFQHEFQRHSGEYRQPLARTRRAEAFQQIAVNWLLPTDASPLETTIAYEQVAVEVTASLAEHEPDPYIAQVLRFGLLEDFDHLYRYAALLDRLEGKDANTLLQCYTDLRPGRPTAVELRFPDDDLRTNYARGQAKPATKLNALTILAAEQQTQNYYQNIGPLFADPAARMLYAEIATIEEQHVTQYGALLDPAESWLEKWLWHEATEVYNYYSCYQSEPNPRIKQLWERFCQYELGHLHFVMDLYKNKERKDPAELLGAQMPELVQYTSHRDFVRRTLDAEVNLRAVGTRIVDRNEEKPGSPSVRYRERLNAQVSPSEAVAAGYRWTPGGEVSLLAQQLRSA